jgi:hypothetical protein
MEYSTRAGQPSGDIVEKEMGILKVPVGGNCIVQQYGNFFVFSPFKGNKRDGQGFPKYKTGFGSGKGSGLGIWSKRRKETDNIVSMET